MTSPRFPVPSRFVAAALVATALFAVVAGIGADRAWARDQAIRVEDNVFSPNQVTVEVGDTVTWSWIGQNPHGVTGDGPIETSHPGCSALTSGACASQGEAPYRVVFDEVGTFDFNCQVHGNMSGTVTVVAPQPEPSQSESAQPEPSDPEPSQSEPSQPQPSQSEPSGEPSPSDSAGAPSPSSSPSAEPVDPRFTVGPPPPRQTAPPVVVDGTVEPAEPTDRETLEPFPSAVDPDSQLAEERASEREQALVADLAASRALAPKIVAGGLILGTLVAFGTFVLFGEPWVTHEDL